MRTGPPRDCRWSCSLGRALGAIRVGRARLGSLGRARLGSLARTPPRVSRAHEPAGRLSISLFLSLSFFSLSLSLSLCLPPSSAEQAGRHARLAEPTAMRARPAPPPQDGRARLGIPRPLSGRRHAISTGVTRNEGHAPPLVRSYAPRHRPTVGS